MSTATCLTCFTSAPPPADPLQAFLPGVPPPLLGGPGQLAMTNSPCRTINHESRWPICALKDEPLPSHWMRWHRGGGAAASGARKVEGPMVVMRGNWTTPPYQMYLPGGSTVSCQTPPKGRALGFTPQQPLLFPHSGYKLHPAPCFCHRCTLHEPQNMPPISCNAGRPTPSRLPMGGGAIRAGAFPFPAFEEAASWLDSISS